MKKLKEEKKKVETEEDEFLLGDEFLEEQKPVSSITTMKPMKDVLKDALLKSTSAMDKAARQRLKNKLRRKNKKKLRKEEEEKEKKKEKKKKMDGSFKYVKNDQLEDDLRGRTLSGVVKIMNLIATHKRNLKEE